MSRGRVLASRTRRGVYKLIYSLCIPYWGWHPDPSPPTTLPSINSSFSLSMKDGVLREYMIDGTCIVDSRIHVAAGLTYQPLILVPVSG